MYCKKKTLSIIRNHADIQGALCVWYSSSCLVFPAVVDNYFLKVQNGEIPSNSCVHSEFLVRNSSLSPRLQCGKICNTDPVCVGFDLIKTEAKRCRLLFGFPAMIPTYTTSDQSARYQKVILQLIRS